MGKTALIILENPWWDLDKNPGHASVFPFFHGLEKLENNLSVYHTTFYDSASFTHALSHLALSDRFDRYFLYIAAHGSERMVANIQIGNFVAILKGYASVANIEGVIIGSCFVGMQKEMLKSAMTGSSVVWSMGYSGSVDWLTSTMIDLAVFKEMISVNKRHLSDREKIFSKFTDAIERFNPGFHIATDKNNNPLSLRDSLSLVIQPRTQGAHPIDMSDALFDFEWIAKDDE